MGFAYLTTIVWHQLVRIVNLIEHQHDSIFHSIILIEVECLALFVLMVFICQTTFPDITLIGQHFNDTHRFLMREAVGVATLVIDHLIIEQRSGNQYRTICHNLCNLRLKFLSEVIVALTGNYGQHIGFVNIHTQHIFVLTFTQFVHTETHTTTNLLTFLRLIIRILQRTNLEHIGIIPSFLQCRVRENETYWFLEAQQSFLILHNQVVSIAVVRVCGATLQLRIDEVTLLIL